MKPPYRIERSLSPLGRVNVKGAAAILIGSLISLALAASPISAQKGEDRLIMEGLNAIRKWAPEEAAVLADRLLTDDRPHPLAFYIKGMAHFQKGKYREALSYAETAAERLPGEGRAESLKELARNTLKAVEGLQRRESQHFSVLLLPQADGLFSDRILDALERAREASGKALGFYPEGKVRVEIYPDAERFYLASGLSRRDIEVTGAVGLCRFNKIMIISPRALLQGYRWLDTLSHEYVHYLISGISENRAPVWIQEGIARFQEAGWRLPESNYMSRLNETLLAEAVGRDRFISFAAMEPSLVKLQSTYDVQLAYAEGASAVDYIIRKVGRAGIRELLRFYSTGDANTSEALTHSMGLNLEEFEKEWKDFLRGLGLQRHVGVPLKQYKLMEEGAQNQEMAELEEIRSMAARRLTALGDRLKDKERMKPALMEYERALKRSPHSPQIMRRLGESLAAVRRGDEALEYLGRALDYQPDSPANHIGMGKVYFDRKEWEEARKRFEESLQINPFDPEPHRYLLAIYEQLGDREGIEREAEIINGLMRLM